jgi:hypothetical protein
VQASDPTSRTTYYPLKTSKQCSRVALSSSYTKTRNAAKAKNPDAADAYSVEKGGQGMSRKERLFARGHNSIKELITEMTTRSH